MPKKPTLPDIGKLNQYDNFNPKSTEEKKAAKKRLYKIMSIVFVAMAVIGMVFIFMIRNESSNISSGEVAKNPADIPSTSTERHDADVSPESGEWIAPGDKNVTGSYDSDSYDLSNYISEALADKYSTSYAFYYIVSEGPESDQFYMTKKDWDKAFLVDLSDNTLSDNLYAWTLLRDLDTQKWLDDYSREVQGIAGILRSTPDTLLGNTGMEFGDMNKLQINTSPDVVILRVNKDGFDLDDKLTAMFQDIAGEEEYADTFSVKVVELKEDAYAKLADLNANEEGSKLTYENYGDVLNDVVKSTVSYTVDRDGTATSDV